MMLLLLNDFRFALVTSLCLLLCSLFVQGDSLDDVYQQWIHEGDKSMKAMNEEDLRKRQDMENSIIAVEVLVDKMTAQINIDGRQVLYQHNTTVQIGPHEYTTGHRGVHIITANPTTGATTLITYYRTWQPRATKGLVQTLTSLQPGSLLVLAAPGDWRMFVDEDTSEFLSIYLRGWWVDVVCIGEMWAAVVTVGGKVWAEAAVTIKGNTTDTSPLRLNAQVPRRPQDTQRECEWGEEPEQVAKRVFCETYEGYGNWCNCNHPLTISPHNAPSLVMKEQIPIVIVTSRRQYKVLRQLGQLWSQAGGGNTSILLSVDGFQQEAADFSHLVRLPTVFHHNPAPPGNNVRINEHIKFSIFHAFKTFQHADKIIVLEDDLILAPDFISYFHQTAPLLDADETIFCVNAFNYNSFHPSAIDATRLYREGVLSYFHQTAPLLDADETIFCINAFNYNSFHPSAIDATRLYREGVLPAYGWMVTRKWATQVLPNWPKRSYFVDWDWYLRAMVQPGRDIITPEVPRTMHDGSGGVHVTGWEQAGYFDRRPLNQLTNVTLNISYLTSEAYESFLQHELSTAKLLLIREHPCIKHYIPKYKVGSFVIYYYGETEKDDHLSYFTLVGCLGGYERGRMEHHHLMHTLGYYGNAVYLIACPGSLYCTIPKEDYGNMVYHAKRNDTMITQLHMDRIIKKVLSPTLLRRVPPLSPEEEFLMENIMVMNIKPTFREIKT